MIFIKVTHKNTKKRIPVNPTKKRTTLKIPPIKKKRKKGRRRRNTIIISKIIKIIHL